MKVEGYVFGFFTVFLAAITAIYWVLSEEVAGTAALGFSAVLSLMIGGYLLLASRRYAARPEDLGDADVADGAGEVGHFSPGSYWPICVAAGATVFFLGLIFGVWLAIIGMLALLAALGGLLFEHFVGEGSIRP